MKTETQSIAEEEWARKEARYTAVKNLLGITNYLSDKEVNQLNDMYQRCMERYQKAAKKGGLLICSKNSEN